VVLFYVYPLKFVFTMLVKIFNGEDLTGAHGGRAIITMTEVPRLMMYYGVGFSAVYLLYLLLYCHAWRQRRELGLNAVEEFDTRVSILEHGGMVIVGLLSISVAYLTRSGGLSGMVYWAIGILQWVLGFWGGARRRKLEAQMVP